MFVQVASLQKEIMALASKASAKNDFKEWVRLAEVVKKINAIAEGAEASLVQLESEAKTPPNNDAPSVAISVSPSDTQQLSAKAIGKEARKKWCQEVAKSGYPLNHLEGPYFSTSSGKTIAIAFAAEKPERPDKFFLGLPDKLVEAFVFLCELETGEVKDAVLPAEFLKKYWHSLSRSSGQLKFNLRCSDGKKFQLHIPSLGWISISDFVGNYGFLQ